MNTRLRRRTIVLLWCVAALIATLRAAMQFSGAVPRLSIPSKSSRVAAKARGGDGERTQGLNTYEFMGVKLKLPDLPTPEVEVDPEVEASVKKTGTNVGQGLAAGGAAAVFAAIALANPVVGAAGVGAAAVAAVVTNLPEAEEESSSKGRSKSSSKSKSEDGSFIDEQSLWDVGKAFGGLLIGGIIGFALAAVFGFSVQIPFLAGGLFGAIAAGGAAWFAVGTPLPDGVSYDEKDGLKLPEIKPGMEIGGFKLPDLPFQDEPEEKKEKAEEEEGFNPFSWLPSSDSKDSKDK